MTTTGPKSPAFTYTVPPEDLLSPIWTLRLVPIAMVLAIILAETVFKASVLHDGLVGFACGLSLSLIFLSFQITGITLRKDQTRSDVDDLHITR